MNTKILLVDDEKDILEFISYNLIKEKYDVITATNGLEALEKLNENPDLIILDVMMPQLDGYETFKKIKENEKYKSIPIIFLTAKNNEKDEIFALNIGAEDFITKPISPQKIIARVKANLRKNELTSNNQNFVQHEFIKIDKEKHLVFINDEEIFFPKKEFELLKLLLENKGKILTRKKILESVWGNEVFVVDRTIDVHIRKIREKLGDYSPYIETIKGIGYKFRESIE
ncbi:MAG: response regulator transcription factor [Stygiobacter sp.]|jgi:two-component system alkaline phosphatase synthesis response regulator PhoP|uniref:Phosphate regulon transcriptional regulatory protein PhoB n=1 Tax=Stygiobacter electus TaxID=3032292 RepID=A0AAE3P0V1_9BACT|nr:response regulator transcription factor [Stygiobacter electus]MDF1610973.1 response regulator transcription factor [Stygiobacter electus]